MTEHERRVKRNPGLGLPSVVRLQRLPRGQRKLLSELLLDIRRDALRRADESWRKHKAPMAAYWKAVGVYAGHISRAIR